MSTIINGTSNAITFPDSTIQTTAFTATPALTSVTTTGGANFATSSGSVGIGTASPTTKLDVVGTIRSSSGSDQGTQLNLWTDINGNGALAAYNILFNTGANNARTETMRIDASGNLLVGTTSNASSARIFIDQPNASPGLTSFINRSSSQSVSGLGIVKKDNDNTTAQIYTTFVYNNFASGAGGIQGNGASGVQFFSSSDVRLKENIVELEPQLKNILALKPSKFDYIDGPKNCTGFIAQEIEKVYPDVVGEDDNGYKTVGGVSIMESRLIKAIQEQQVMIEELKAKVVALEAK